MARKDRSSSRRPEGRGGKGRAGDGRAPKGRPGPRGGAAKGRPGSAGGGPRGRPAAGGGASKGRLTGARGPGGTADRGASKGRAAAAGGPGPAADPPAPEIVAPVANVYGRNAVREALRGRRRVKRIWATAGTAREGFAGAPLVIVPAEEVTTRCGSDSHQGVCAEAESYPYAGAAELLAVPDPLIVVLDEVTDPQNLGAVIRTAECAGVTGVVIPERRSAEVTGAVAKASAGAIEHMRVARVRNLADFLGEAKAANCWIYGAAAGAATTYDAPDYSGGVVLVLGAEGRGLRPRVAGACDELVSLPLRGRIDSLNVSAAGAVLMYAILQKRLDTST